FIERLIATRETTKKDVIASSYADTVGVPSLFNRSLFKELLSLGDDSGAKSIILRSPERVARLAFPKGAVDIDTWKDWEKLNRGSPKTMGKAVTKIDRKSTRLNSSRRTISYAVFCLKKKTPNTR